MQDQLEYHDNERALCYHGPLIYEAIIKAELWTDPKMHGGQSGPHYFVHYKGWKQTWDEFVPETRLLKFNEENIARQKALNEAQRAKDRAEKEALKAGTLDTALHAKGSSGLASARAHTAAFVNQGPSGGPLSASSSSGLPKDGLVSAGGASSHRGTKRSRDNVAEEDEFRSKPEIKLVIPDAIKVKLVDDWEAITKNSQLIPLPRTPSVITILEEFEAAQKISERPSRSTSLTHEVVAGLQLYFDKSLGNNLLYRFERQQYGDIRRKYTPAASTDGTAKETAEKSMSEVYGVEHLCRLFVNLPELIAHTSMDAETVTVLREALQDLMKWIVQEQDRLFNVKYEETSSAYQNVSRA